MGREGLRVRMRTGRAVRLAVVGEDLADLAGGVVDQQVPGCGPSAMRGTAAIGYGRQAGYRENPV